MSQRTSRLQQENARLRDEIRRLKGALKEANQEYSKVSPAFKSQRDRSSASRKRKISCRKNSEERINTVSSKTIEKQKSLMYIDEPKDLQVIEANPRFKNENNERFLDDSHESSISNLEAFSSKPSPKMPEILKEIPESSLNLTNSIEKNPESINFSSVKPETAQFSEPKLLKDSFSSFYDDTINKTLNESEISYPAPPENPQNLKCAKLSKPPAPSKPNIPINPANIPNDYKVHDNSLFLEIEALRRENTKLRLQLNTSSKRNLKKPTIRGRSKSRSKTPVRTTKSKSNTPRDFSSRPMRRNISNKSFTDSGSLSRRNKHCITCDHFLSKGYSTIYCSKHGNPKLTNKPY